MGWLMVKSGLIDDPKVNPVRLSLHLGLALAIFSAELWIAMGLLAPRGGPRPRLAAALPWVVFAMALSGGMVAGLRAGYAYNSFPLMNGHLVPPEVLMLEPWWTNFLYNMATVQLVHRVAASTAALTILAAGWLLWRSGRRARAAILVALMLALSALGAATGTQPPAWAAAGNLLGGLLLAALLAWLLGRERRRGGEPLLHAAAVLLVAQAALGAWCSIVEKDEVWTFALLGHATLGLALAGLVAWRALHARAWGLLALAGLAPLAGMVSALLDAPLGPALAHATSAALLTAAVAYAHARLT